MNKLVTMIAQLKSIGLFTFSHGSYQNQQGGVSLSCGVQLFVLFPPVVVWWHFHVAGGNSNFEEILQYLYFTLQAERKTFIVINECMNEREPIRILAYAYYILAFLSQPNRAYSSLTELGSFRLLLFHLLKINLSTQ